MDHHSRLVTAERLLELKFDTDSRPSLRYLRSLQKRRIIPFYKIGRLVFFDPDEVMRALSVANLVSAKTTGRRFSGNLRLAGIAADKEAAK